MATPFRPHVPAATDENSFRGEQAPHELAACRIGVDDNTAALD